MKYIENSWASEYRKKRFYENQKRRLMNQDKDASLFKKATDRSIAVMLDLEGVSDDIDLEIASIFIRELDILRKKFGAKFCYICISTHAHDKNKMKDILDILSNFTTKNILIGENFFYGASYDYETDTVKNKGAFFNTNKIETFKAEYLNNYYTNNVWFMVADDNLDSETYLKYQDIHPCLFIKPGSKDYSNFMSISTEVSGFNGVIDSLHTYIQSIKKLSLIKILDQQKNMVCHLSSCDLIKKIRNHEYNYLIEYFEEGYADENDYYDTITWLSFSEDIELTDLVLVSRLLNLLKSHAISENSQIKIRSLEEKWGIK